MSGDPGTYVANADLVIARSAPGGVMITARPLSSSSVPLNSPRPAARAVLVIVVLSGIPPLTVTSNVIVAEAPAASVPIVPVTPLPWLPVIEPWVDVRLPA